MSSSEEELKWQGDGKLNLLRWVEVKQVTKLEQMVGDKRWRSGLKEEALAWQLGFAIL